MLGVVSSSWKTSSIPWSLRCFDGTQQQVQVLTSSGLLDGGCRITGFEVKETLRADLSAGGQMHKAAGQ